MKYENEIGNTYNKLKIMAFSHQVKNRYYYFCKCKCGKIKAINVYHVIKGVVKSCGCLLKRILVKRNIVHGKYGIPEYRAWIGINNRCYNQNEPRYKNYGGRGIRVCERWRYSFETFLNDMGRRPSNKHSIDRIDNDGNYSPENCRWSLPIIQANNRTTSVFHEYKGKIYTMREIAKVLNVNISTLYSRYYRNGKNINEVLKGFSFPD